MLFSVLTFAGLAAIGIGGIELWTRGKPTIPIALLTTAMLFCLVISSQLAIVPAILLAAMIVVIAVRHPDAEAE